MAISIRTRLLAALATVASLMLLPAPAAARDGLVTAPSAYPVAETMDRLERAVRDRGLVVVGRVDHAGAAQKAGLTLRPTQLLIFGNPRAGTPLMQSARSIGIDLPLRVLVWEDERGQAQLTYNDPAWLAARHGVADRAEVVQTMRTALEALADVATKASR